MLPNHATQTDPYLHETKGASTATAGYVLIASGTGGATFQTASSGLLSGGLVRSLIYTSTASATSTATIPFDNTIPTSGEGVQVISQAWTPLAANNRIRVLVQTLVSASTAAHVSGAIFQGADAAASAAAAVKLTASGDTNLLHLVYEYTATSTASTTISVRVGASTAATTTYNGSAGTQLFGGVSNSWIQFMEFKA